MINTNLKIYLLKDTAILNGMIFKTESEESVDDKSVKTAQEDLKLFMPQL